MWIWAAPRIGKRFLESCKLSEEQTILKALPFKVYLSFRPLDGLCHQQICLHRRDRLRALVFTMYVERWLDSVPFWVEECCYVVRYRGQHENLLDIDCVPVFASLSPAFLLLASQLAFLFDAAQREQENLFICWTCLAMERRKNNYHGHRHKFVIGSYSACCFMFLWFPRKSRSAALSRFQILRKLKFHNCAFESCYQKAVGCQSAVLA